MCQMDTHIYALYLKLRRIWRLVDMYLDFHTDLAVLCVYRVPAVVFDNFYIENLDVVSSF